MLKDLGLQLVVQALNNLYGITVVKFFFVNTEKNRLSMKILEKRHGNVNFTRLNHLRMLKLKTDLSCIKKLKLFKDFDGFKVSCTRS